MTYSVCPVTVVIPFFNGHDTIGRAVRSIMGQQVRPAEVIVVDDGSREPLQREQIDVPGNIKILRHPTNKGIPSARNTGILAASQDWIAFLDQDDEYTPDKLARQWAAVVRSGYDTELVFWGRILVEGPEGSRVCPPTRSVAQVCRSSKSALRELLVRGMVVPFITLLVHRRIFERYGLLDPDIRGGADDYEFVLRMAASGARFFNTDINHGQNSFSAIHHYTGVNYSNNGRRILEDNQVIMHNLGLRFPSIRRLVARGAARVEYTFGRYYHTSGQLPRAIVHYRRAIAAWPFTWRPWAGLTLAYLPTGTQTLIMDRFATWKAARKKL